MTSVSFPASQPQWPNSPQLHPHHAYQYSQPVVSGSARLPNPAFTFPAREPEPIQHANTMEPGNSSPLPEFSFPQAPEPASPSLPSTTTTSQRPNGHHRLGSELLGRDDAANGDINGSNPAPPAPSLLPEPGPGVGGPPPSRRRHAHRRSAAISSVDLTAVTKAFPPTPVGGSAPVTPSDMKQQHSLNDDTAKSTSRTFPIMGPRSPPLSSARSEDYSKLAVPPMSPPVDNFPPVHQPLSTISLTESSTSTLQLPPHHAVTESASSRSRSPQRDLHSVRPKTAGAKFEQTEANTTGSVGTEHQKRPVSFSASTSTVPTDTDIPDVPPLPKPGPFAHSDAHSRRDPPPETVQKPDDLESSDPIASDKKSIKKKKVRSWAGILTRKAKKRAQGKKALSRKAPTPPSLTRTNSEIGSITGVDFDQDNTVIIRSPTFPNAAPQQVTCQPPSDSQPSLETSWKPRSFYEQGKESDIFSPVIDLDAALGPFNTPEMGTEDAQASGFSVATKRMYSGGLRGQFVGPEMRYHRRTESAPEMPPFDRTSLTVTSRIGGTSTMANPDVFDEEEEDAFLAETSESKPAADVTSSEQNAEKQSTRDNNKCEAGLGIQVVDSADPLHPRDAAPVQQSSESRPSTIHVATPLTPNGNSAGGQITPQEARASVEIVDVDQLTMRFEKSPNPPPSSRSPLEEKRPATSPDFAVPKFGFLSELPPSPANFPSPDPSLEAPRLATASSSMTDRQTFNSCYSGESGNDYYIHYSTEDVPSLTSTASTATGTAPRTSSNFYSRALGNRSGSLHTARPPKSSGSNTSKRSSLASLTKLVGASSGERSKLSHEEKAPQDEPAKTKRKAYRFSRLVHFWKDKEKPKELE